MKVLLIPADPTRGLELHELSEPHYDGMHKLVGGYIEIVRTDELKCIHKNLVMVANEEGWVQEPPLPFNERATVFYPFGLGIAGDAFLVGEDLVFNVEEGYDEMDFVDLPTDVLRIILR